VRHFLCARDNPTYLGSGIIWAAAPPTRHAAGDHVGHDQLAAQALDGLLAALDRRLHRGHVARTMIVT